MGAITGATRRKKLLETSARARHEAANTEDWHPERQWHYFPVSVVEETTGAMQATSAYHAEANVVAGGAGSFCAAAAGAVEVRKLELMVSARLTSCSCVWMLIARLPGRACRCCFEC